MSIVGKIISGILVEWSEHFYFVYYKDLDILFLITRELESRRLVQNNLQLIGLESVKLNTRQSERSCREERWYDYCLIF